MTTERLAILRGHAEAVLCCETAASQPLLATGSEVSRYTLRALSQAKQDFVSASQKRHVFHLHVKSATARTPAGRDHLSS